VSSPRVGCSILMTSAPRSPRICVQYGCDLFVSKTFHVVSVAEGVKSVGSKVSIW
jgi:hypothetical protein